METTHHTQDHQHVRSVGNERSYTLRIPKLNWQVTALILIALVAAFQSWQLTRLTKNVAAQTTATSAAPATAQSSDSSGLQSQVGGC